ncbi:hypothetical protein [Mangrovimonas cancribranchiae]|uniref:SGNH hydrolase-type esterase domain-containing protein n=1 Tax=Mangrovimonas cancribranchiae TaxID=3080055 RepID=A0AAU6NYB2_9FLAO
MKKIQRNTLLFIFPILLVWISIECFYRITPNNYSFKQKQIPKHYNVAKGLIFGDSHYFYGLNPESFSRPVFNMANISQTIYFDELLFKKHIDSFKKLEFVIFPMEYTTLSQADNTQEDVWRKYFYRYNMELEVPLITTFDLKKYSLALTRKLKHTIRTITQYINEGTLIGCDKRGWGNTYVTAVDSLEMERLAKIISAKHDDGSMVFSHNITRLKGMISICAKKQIKVFLVNMPVGEPYLNKLDYKEVKAIERISKQLSEKYANVFNINLLRNPKFKLSDFHDADHLNIKGAKKCSKIIDAEVSRYLK